MFLFPIRASNSLPDSEMGEDPRYSLGMGSIQLEASPDQEKGEGFCRVGILSLNSLSAAYTTSEA